MSSIEISEEDIINEIDFSDLEAQYKVEEPTAYLDNYIVVDGAPVAPESKAGALEKVLTKLFSAAGKIVNFHLPVEDGKTKGFVIIEYEKPQMVNSAIKQLHGKKLDVKHRLLVNKLSDVERFAIEGKVKDEFEEPSIPPLENHGYLKSWLQDENVRDQFMLHHNDTVGVFWNNYKSNPEPVIEPRAHWTSAYMKFSPKGTYFFSMFPGGVQSWGGANFQRIKRFIHPGVRLIDISPSEKFLITISPEPISLPPDDHPAKASYPFSEENIGHKLVIWDLQSGLPVRSFPLPPNLETASSMPWPLVKWSYDDKYCARMGPDALAVYETETFQLVDKKIVKIEGIVDFEFAPAGVRFATTKKTDDPEHVLAYWTPELNNQSATASIMQIPSKQVIRSVNLVQVSNCKLYWQDNASYLAVKVDRHTKSKKTNFSNLEIFSLLEKDVPLEKIEVKEVIVDFAWEPKGDKFVTLSKLDNPTANAAFAENILSFYAPEELKSNKAVSSQRWLLVKAINESFANGIFWSPKGRFVVFATFNGVNSELEFYDTVVEGEKFKDQNNSKVNANVQRLVVTPYKGVSDLQWDTSGNYLAAWSSSDKSKFENGFKVYDLTGTLLREDLIGGFKEFAWRPRPASLLSAADRKKVRKNLREYTAQFEEQDAMDANIELREIILTRRKLLEEWTNWRHEIDSKLKELHLEYKIDTAENEVVEEIQEEIVEEKEEIIE